MYGLVHVVAIINIFSTCTQEAQSYADENSLLFMETSAKTAMNVNETFLAIGERNSVTGRSSKCLLA